MKKGALFFFIASLLLGCHKKPEITINQDERVLIPLAQKYTPTNQAFLIDNKTKLYFIGNDQAKPIIEQLANSLRRVTGYPLEVSKRDNFKKKNAIYFSLEPLDSLPDEEAYMIEVTRERGILKSSDAAGLFRGLQTLMQLLPDQVVGDTLQTDVVWGIPGGTILDYPKYEYRGAMLDVARHFFTVDQVKRYIDLLAQYKINTLHLHLTDDQGWRIEIKSWPKLTEIGGSTAVGGGKGGYFSQDDYSTIVAYASSKFITIIPEIDMPGHTNAALASYPELNCDGKATELYTGMRVGFSSLCVDKEITYQFINDVIKELAAITPGEYIHLGGDESHATSKEDYNIFLQKAKKIVELHGKKIMGWEDIQSAGVDSTVIVQHWTNAQTASKGALQGARVVLSPAPKTYLDMKYTNETSIGLTWAGPTDIETAYLWDPSSQLKDVNSDQIIGIESPLWTETVLTIDDIEFLAFPRVIGHAELGWLGSENLSWDSYKKRLMEHSKRLDLQEINYYKSNKLDN